MNKQANTTERDQQMQLNIFETKSLANSKIIFTLFSSDAKFGAPFSKST